MLGRLGGNALPSSLDAFREELRAWLDTHLTDELRVGPISDPTGASGDDFARRLIWQQTLHTGGWVGVHWPRQFGGRSASLLEHAAYLIDCGLAGAPEPVNVIGLNMVGPTLIAHGSEQQRRLLPDILSARMIWAQLYSEPDAGSDLGSISTRARRTAGGWIVNGQKIWTSWGLEAGMGLLLARTGGERLHGLTCFLVDMSAPGITVRGIRQMSGDTHFSEVFFDGVHLAHDAIVGEVDDGWRVATSTLKHERTTAILSRHASTLAAADELVRRASSADTATGRDRAVRLWSEAQLFVLNGQRGVVESSLGRPTVVSLTQRLQWGRLTQAIFEEGTSLVGAEALAYWGEPDPWAQMLAVSRGWTIGGGTSEIQRNMLGEQVLCLPRDQRTPPRPRLTQDRANNTVTDCSVSKYSGGS